MLDELAQTVAPHGVNTAPLKPMLTPPVAESASAQTERTDQLALRLATIYARGAIAPGQADGASHIPTGATEPSVGELRLLAAPALRARITALAPQSAAYGALQ
jgi:hypothetical protein